MISLWILFIWLLRRHNEPEIWSDFYPDNRVHTRSYSHIHTKMCDVQLCNPIHIVIYVSSFQHTFFMGWCKNEKHFGFVWVINIWDTVFPIKACKCCIDGLEMCVWDDTRSDRWLTRALKMYMHLINKGCCCCFILSEITQCRYLILNLLYSYIDFFVRTLCTHQQSHEQTHTDCFIQLFMSL